MTASVPGRLPCPNPACLPRHPPTSAPHRDFCMFLRNTSSCNRSACRHLIEVLDQPSLTGILWAYVEFLWGLGFPDLLTPRGVRPRKDPKIKFQLCRFSSLSGVCFYSPGQHVYHLNCILKDQNMPVTLRCKVCILGDPCVGKSALTQMFLTNGQKYLQNYQMTVGGSLAVKEIAIPETDCKVEMYLYDLSGQDMYKDLVSQYYPNTSMVCLVYDCANQSTFHNLSNWIRAVRKANGDRVLPGVVIANKKDKAEAAQVTSFQGSEFARAQNLEFFETSAATGADVDMPFNSMANGFYRAYTERQEQISHIFGGGLPPLTVPFTPASPGIPSPLLPSSSTFAQPTMDGMSPSYAPRR
ncbi:putative IFT27 [Paratrimastix pyriformis]|uniref:IFT27 n=1 Tax=Paratrimastix pyriformis TaxID=342808 RepID=A0ABQ8UVR8_9EUKA|nr:putative IFT27 [Paratrimastix pyriformis]